MCLLTVISSHRIKCNISAESSQQYGHFIFLHQHIWSNLRGRYDLKPAKSRFFLVSVISLYRIKCNIPIEISQQYLYFILFYWSTRFEFLYLTYDPKTKKKMRFLHCNYVLCLHRIKCNISIESSHQDLHFVFYTDELSTINAGILIKKLKKLRFF